MSLAVGRKAPAARKLMREAWCVFLASRLYSFVPSVRTPKSTSLQVVVTPGADVRLKVHTHTSGSVSVLPDNYLDTVSKETR